MRPITANSVNLIAVEIPAIAGVRIETHERDPWTIEADPRIKLATARLAA
jgi:hypothetical protein